MKANGELGLIGRLPAPKQAPQNVLALCQNVGDAMRVAIITNPRHLSQAQIARDLGKSPSYLSEIINGTKPLPLRLVTPFSYLTGTWIVRQFIDLQEAMRDVAARNTRTDRINRIVREMERAA
jgi:plasmid maintenance system antidote protein VapI